MSAVDQSDQSALHFPCVFPIKAMGKTAPDFDVLVVSIVRRHAPDLGEGAVAVRASAEGKYLAVTVTINAHNRAQLDAIYQDLVACEQVLFAI